MGKPVPLTDWARLGATSLQMSEEQLRNCGFEHIFETSVIPGFRIDEYLKENVEKHVHDEWSYYAKMVPMHGMILVMGFKSETDMIVARMLVD